MKIIQIISGRFWGGGQAYVLDLCKRQVEDGHDVEVITNNQPEVLQPFIDAGIKVTPMTLRGHLTQITVARIAAKLLTCPEGTVINAHRHGDLSIAVNARSLVRAKSKIRIIKTTHLIEPAVNNKKFDRLHREVDAMVFVSGAALKGFLSSSPSIDRSKLHIIHNSIANPPSPKPKALQSGDPTRLLFLGRVVPEKGLDTLIEALSFVPEITLSIAGTGESDYIDSLRQQAATLGLSERIEWLGFQKNVYTAINHCDIGVAPSRCQESFGLILLEYMSQGIPVISSSNGAQPEIITDGIDGLLVPPESPAELAEAIRTLANDPSLRKKIGEKGRQTFVERFSYDNFYSKLMKIYRG